MRRRAFLCVASTALLLVACATSSEPLTGPGLIFVYTDN
jgi:hypothetical protein